MPLYDFKNKETGEVETHFLKVSELDDFKAEMTHLEKMVSAPKVDTSPAFPTKPPQGFRDHLNKMKKGHKNSTINSF